MAAFFCGEQSGHHCLKWLSQGSEANKESRDQVKPSSFICVWWEHLCSYVRCNALQRHMCAYVSKIQSHETKARQRQKGRSMGALQNLAKPSQPQGRCCGSHQYTKLQEKAAPLFPDPWTTQSHAKHMQCSLLSTNT